MNMEILLAHRAYTARDPNRRQEIGTKEYEYMKVARLRVWNELLIATAK